MACDLSEVEYSHGLELCTSKSLFNGLNFEYSNNYLNRFNIFIKFLLANRIIGKAMENRLFLICHSYYCSNDQVLKNQKYICIKDSESRPRHNQFTVIHCCFTVASQVVQITNLNENRVQTGLLLFEWDIKIQSPYEQMQIFIITVIFIYNASLRLGNYIWRIFSELELLMPPFNNDIEMICMIAVIGHSSMRMKLCMLPIIQQNHNRWGKKMSKIDSFES